MNIAIKTKAIMFNKIQKFLAINSQSEDAWMGVLHTCPFCGADLPDLRFEYWGEMRKSYPELYTSFNEKTTMYDDIIPDEFKTDEWWKKRGL